MLAIGQLMDSLNLAERIDQVFPLPKSNRGFKPSAFIQTLILMQHEGSFRLDDVRNLHDDQALRTVLDLEKLPQASALGEWLRRVGNLERTLMDWTTVNQAVLKSALHHCREVTLNIDATEVVANKTSAQWTYRSNKGYMPMVGHIAETGQVVAVDFRHGNTSPAARNLEFILHCQHALPEGCSIKALRIDAAGYQTKIIQHCDQNGIHYAIRAAANRAIKAQMATQSEGDGQSMIGKDGEIVEGEATCRTTHCIGDYDKAFTLVIQRTRKKGPAELDLDEQNERDEISADGYVYRAIATNRDDWSDSQIIHWYNQRGEESENRIKELKLDFGGDTLPCSDFKANELYFLISALSYNLFALMRQLLPEALSNHRAVTIRWRLYGMAAKVVRTARQLFVKLEDKNQRLLAQVLALLRRFEPPPI